jgi:hypothetical protein
MNCFSALSGLPELLFQVARFFLDRLAFFASLEAVEFFEGVTELVKKMTVVIPGEAGCETEGFFTRAHHRS